MRISYWSSDVCSSDLAAALAGFVPQHQCRKHASVGVHAGGDVGNGAAGFGHLGLAGPAGNRKKAALALNQPIVGFLLDRKSVVSGKKVSVRVDLGGRRLI